MLRGFLFGLGLMSGTMLSQSVFAEPAALQIIVSKDKQSLAVYDGDTVVATSKVSTGKAGHTTPSGIFSILEKRKYHESNIYSDAPMPWMQRLTWSGIALHEGNVPNYPASHGCVRLPAGTAKTLFDMTDRGVHVLITDAPVVPAKIEHANLFRPLRPQPTAPLLTDVDLRPTAMKRPVRGPVEVAMAGQDPMTTGSLQPVAEEDGPPLRILVHRRGARETMMDVQALLGELGFAAGAADGLAGPQTRQAIAAYKRWKGLPSAGALVTKDFLAALYASAGKQEPPAGQILVRRNFEPLFEAPIGIRNPERALGTHFFSVDHVERGSETAQWHAVTLPNELGADELKQLGIETPADPQAPDAATAMLDRLEIPAEVREAISTLLTNGSSMTVTDQGLGPETGKGTDFVTLTRSHTLVAKNEPAPSRPRSSKRSQRDSFVGGIGLY